MKRLLSAYVDGQVKEEEQRMVEQHLSECRECMAELGVMKRIGEILSQQERVEPKPYFWTRLEARLEQEQRRSRRWARFEWMFRRLTPILAGATAVLLLMFSMQRNRDTNGALLLAEMWSLQEEEVVLIGQSELSPNDVLVLLVSPSDNASKERR